MEFDVDARNLLASIPGGFTSNNDIFPGQEVMVRVKGEEGKTTEFSTICRIDTLVELDYYRNGGILQTVLRQLLKSR